MNITYPTTENKTNTTPGGNITVYYAYTEENPVNLTLQLLNQSNAAVGMTFLDTLAGGTNMSDFTHILVPGDAEGYYHVKAIMYDVAGNNGTSIQPNSTLISSANTQEIQLKAGWNLISLPFEIT